MLNRLEAPSTPAPQAVELNERGKPKIARLEYIDGLRGIAATLVIVYHYCARWTPPKSPINLYPYGDALNYLPISQHAEYALMMLFVVSGFVVTLTVERCKSPFEFAVRRFSRMWPALTLCCCLTYLTLVLLPNAPWKPGLWAFIPSLTTIDPVLLNVLFGTSRFDYMDGAYWTLWVEIKFYVIIALLYFGLGLNYRRVLFWGALAVSIGYWLALVFKLSVLSLLLRHVFIAQFAPWFLVGIGFYYVYKDKCAWHQQPILLLGIASLLMHELASGGVMKAMIALLVPLVFHAAMTVPVVSRGLSSRFLTSIGAASFCMYLLHQRIGVAFMYWLGSMLEMPVLMAVGVAVATGTAVTLVSMKLYDAYEQPLNQRIAAAILRRWGEGEPLSRTWARLKRRSA